MLKVAVDGFVNEGVKIGRKICGHISLCIYLSTYLFSFLVKKENKIS
jgi:hypothetical protein